MCSTAPNVNSFQRKMDSSFQKQYCSLAQFMSDSCLDKTVCKNYCNPNQYFKSLSCQLRQAGGQILFLLLN